MDPSILEPAELLNRRAAAIRAVQRLEMNSFTRALEALDRVAAAAGPIAIVGGLASIHHRAVVTTLDIDIVVSAEQMVAFLEAAGPQGLHLKQHSAEGWHILEFRDESAPVAIHVIPEGGRTPRDPAHAPPVPSPKALGVRQGLGYASFAGWTLLKLVANREKDRYHLVEALKEADQQQISEVVVLLRKEAPRYLAEFERLVRAAEDERHEPW